MTRLIFDIETVGVDFNSLDKKSQEYVLEFAKDPKDAEQKKENLVFSPLTGEIVAIGILNPDTDKGALYFHDPENKIEKKTEDNVQYVPCKDEKQILKEFWQTSQFYDQFITFGGHNFDCPYLAIRSAINKIKPSKKLMGYRFAKAHDMHIDLYDQLTNFGAMREGRKNLHMWCQAFGIKSSKAKGITGDNVGQLYKEKKYLDIARYCADDLWATKELFNYWDKYIK